MLGHSDRKVFRLWCNADGSARAEALPQPLKPVAEVLKREWLDVWQVPERTVRRLWTSSSGWFVGRTLQFDAKALLEALTPDQVQKLCPLTPALSDREKIEAVWASGGKRSKSVEALLALCPIEEQITEVGNRALDLVERACTDSLCEVEETARHLERLDKCLRLAARCATLGERQSALTQSAKLIERVIGCIRMPGRVPDL